MRHIQDAHAFECLTQDSPLIGGRVVSDPGAAQFCAPKSDHTLISDRLPDPAQLAAIEVVCEGSHSLRQKVTDITRRTVYLIQSGRKPLVSCQLADVSSIARHGRLRCRGIAGIFACTTPLSGMASSRDRVVESEDLIRCSTSFLCDNAIGRSGRRRAILAPCTWAGSATKLACRWVSTGR